MIRPTIEEQEVFERAIEFDDLAAREDYLQQACNGDPELRKRIDKLLQFHDTDEDFLETPAVRVPCQRPEDMTDTRIGPYSILKRIGEGGFGVVYQARQEKPVRRDVAIKIIKPGMDTRQIIGRFETERQALAMMNHRSIATVLDAGATESGRLYFVMELVKGKPIDKFCEQHELSLTQRVKLFVEVCQAIQHAHQKGIIHRDLKPSNILVQYEGKHPTAKVIDFGIAKAIETPLHSESPQTDLKQLLGTPEYMSPEQVTPDLDVDTRADVYTLGGTLYKLLTGVPPLDAELIRQAQFDQIYQLIREHEPIRPSVRLQSEANISGRNTANRVSKRALQGELDWIVLKALQKDRTERYDSAAEFARDLERFLACQPVMAGPPSVVYRAKKFLYRNRNWVAATMLVFAALLVGFLRVERERWKTYQQWQRAERERLVADQQRQRATEAAQEKLQAALILEEMILASGPNQGRPADEAMRRQLDELADSVDTKLRNDPQLEARLRRIIGRLWLTLWEVDKAGYHLQRALELRQREFGNTHSMTTQSQVDFARYLDSASRLDEAEKMVNDALVRLRVAEPSEELIEALDVLQRIRRVEQEHEEQRDLAKEAWDVARELHGSDHPMTLLWQSRVASTVLIKANQVEEAFHLAEDALERISKIREKDHLDVALAKQCFARVLIRCNELEQAETLVTESLVVHRRLIGRDSQHVIQDLVSLAKIQRDSRRNDEALATAREAVAIAERSSTEGDRQRLNAYNLLRKMTFRIAPHESAEAARQVALARYRLVPNHPNVRRAMGFRVSAMKFRRIGRIDKATDCFRQAITILLKHPDENEQDISQTLTRFIGMLCENERTAYAEEFLVETLTTLEGDPMANAAIIGIANDALVDVHCRSGDVAAAESHLRQTIQVARESSDKNAAIVRPLRKLAFLLRYRHQWQESAKCYRDLLALLQRDGTDQDAIVETLHEFGDMLREAGKPAEAENHFLDAMKMADSSHIRFPILQIDHLQSLIEQGRLKEAEQRSAVLTKAADSDTPYALVLSQTSEALLLLAKSEDNDAVKLIRKALYSRRLNKNAQLASRLRGLEVQALIRLERFEQAEKGLLKAENAMNILSFPAMICHRVRKQLVELYEGWGETDEADRWRGMLIL